MFDGIINQKEATILIFGYLRHYKQNVLKKQKNLDKIALYLIISQCVSFYFIPKRFPSLIVLDLDACVWTPETYELSTGKMQKIKEKINGKSLITKLKFGKKTLRIFDGARTALLELYKGRYDGLCNPNINGGNMRFALASSANEVHAANFSHPALSTIEIEPGVTMREVVNRGWNLNAIKNEHIQIGNSYPLSHDKSETHFPLIQKATGIPYDEMLFFDDSYWSDNCGQVEEGCPGVVALRTPDGLTVRKWREGLLKWQQKQQQNQ